MGYYTYHKLTASDGNEELYAQELSKVPGGYNPEDYLGEGDCIKWHEEEHDMLELSRRYPDVVFRVDGEPFFSPIGSARPCGRRFSRDLAARQRT